MAHKLCCYLTRYIILTIYFLSSGVDAGIRMRPNKEDLKEIGTEFDSRWKSYYADAPDKPVVFIGICAGKVFLPRGSHKSHPL